MGILYDVYIKHKNIDNYTRKTSSNESISKENKKKYSSEKVINDKKKK